MPKVPKKFTGKDLIDPDEPPDILKPFIIRIDGATLRGNAENPSLNKRVNGKFTVAGRHVHADEPEHE